MRISLRAIRWGLWVSLITLIFLGIPQEILKSYLVSTYFPRNAKYYIIPPISFLWWSFDGIYLTGESLAGLIAKAIVYLIAFLTLPFAGRLLLNILKIIR